MPKQRFDGAGFACGDSAGDSQNGHGQSGRRPAVTWASAATAVA
jgi:hypothetical protein